MDSSTITHAGGFEDLVQLDQDHPGFRDPEYRARRNAIARLALDYREPNPVPRVDYSVTEHAVWRSVWKELRPFHEKLACRAYLECSRTLPLDQEEIPALEDVNVILMENGGFRMLPVAGLVSSRTFMSYLDRSIFLATQYIRHHSRPLYTPEPDVVHELIGHAASFVHPEFQRLNRAFGAATNRCSDERVEQIARLYWYTLEFGAVEEDGGIKAFGAGLLSSGGEIARLLDSSMELREFDIERIISTPYDPTDFQHHYYVAHSFEALVGEIADWLAAL